MTHMENVMKMFEEIFRIQRYKHIKIKDSQQDQEKISNSCLEVGETRTDLSLQLPNFQ